MNDFLFLFRNEEKAAAAAAAQQSPEQMQAITQKWMDWVSDIDAKGQLADHGNRLKRTGKVLRPGGLVTDGPYMELKEALGGYIMVRAADLAAATKLAEGCPALELGGNVEIREIDPIVRK